MLFIHEEPCKCYLCGIKLLFMKNLLVSFSLLFAFFLVVPISHAQDSTKVRKECDMCAKGKCSCDKNKVKKTVKNKKACSCHRKAKASVKK